MSDDVYVYPVGLHRAVWQWWLFRRHPRGGRSETRRLLRDVRRGWRRRSYWNGYLAEAEGSGARRAGHGWTKRRARRDLDRHLRTGQ